MQRSILWRRHDIPGHEVAHLSQSGADWVLEGAALLGFEGQPCRLEYMIQLDQSWHTREAVVHGWIGATRHCVDLHVDPSGQWNVGDQPVPDVQGCIDLDLNFSPSTNLLPIRRLNLAPGEEARVRAAWLRFPSFALEPLDQVYRRLSESLYVYESGDGAFKAELEVTADGLVTRYGNLWNVEALD